MKHSTRFICTVVAALMAVLPIPSASAQILYGGLVGNVTDSSGAAVPGAKVIINHVVTGTTREAITNESGTYRFPTISPGSQTPPAKRVA